MTNPTDPAKEVVYAYARMNGIKGSDYMQPLADLVKSYGDQREAAERERVVAWLREQGDNLSAALMQIPDEFARKIDETASAYEAAANSIEAGLHLKGSGGE